ncbi:hypothetical protein H1230_18965 [Paenibacillus sp. 19GGS1-52]|uniref:hypothetical protein n=1 Tax=Paenibacillus sp. 19GGS1-52 TaxID=2758563 RepID=UPI001EFAE6CC|nr:hypothetical protein [Paenibacillus sp. 19GGS1-52]ULO05190.1 hypothetical protein H1230_18965 [Paenibacillus sp. 19GGS1-52]
MLKLLKYDFRRNRDRILRVYAITLLVQVGLWIFADKTGIWILGKETNGGMFIGNIFTYLVAGIILQSYNIRTYDHNLRSYHRRLLPVNPVLSVLSPLLLGWILLLGVVAMAELHLGLYILFNSADFLPANFWSVSTASLLQMVWVAGYLMILLMLSITVARSLRIKGQVWIGIAVFFIVENGISYIEQQLFGKSFSALENALQFHMVDGKITPDLYLTSGSIVNVGAVLFEVITAAVVLYIIVLLFKKRVES